MAMINAAVIGLGRWGKSLVTAVQGKSQRLRFVHGVSKEPDDVRAFATQHGFRLSTELDDAIADPDVQAVFLATPHSLHVEQVAAVARAGKPVWCEKPLALTRAEAARAVEACRKAGVVLGTGNNKRCFASMRELKAWSRAARSARSSTSRGISPTSTRPASPAAGATIRANRRARADRRRPARARRADQSRRPDQERRRQGFEQKPPPDPRDLVAALVQFASGATGMLATVRAAPIWRVHVFGTKGLAEARDEDTLTVSLIGGTPQTHTFEHVDSLKVLAESFADAVEGRAPFLVSTDQMLDLIGAFEAILASLKTRAPAHING